MKMLFAAFILIMAPPAALAQTGPVPVASAADGKARQFLAVIMPEEALIQMVRAGFANGLKDESKFEPERRKLFAENPGLKAAVADRVIGELERILRNALPGLRADLEKQLTAGMTAAEIGDVLTFFASPAGRKMLGVMYASFADSGVEDPAAAKQAAMAKVMASLTPDDYPALMAFGASAASKKLPQLSPKLNATSEAWSQRVISENGASLALAVDRVIAEFLAKKKS